MTDKLAAGSFTWLVGIEDTCVYPSEQYAMAVLDEYDLTQHSIHWRDDLKSARDLGATAVRYGVNWPLVHIAPGQFDWTMLDERLTYAVEELGLTVIADLVHYGTPTWLAGSFADPDYPEVVAEFVGRFAGRFKGLVDHLTPLNEPVTTASFCGLRGVWPPALTGWDGWTRVTLGIARGMALSIAAAREANPGAVIVHVEASSLYAAEEAHLDDHAELLESVGMLPTDLLLGRVTPDHELFGWLIDHGADTDQLHRLTLDPPTIDLLGVNYYPDLSPRTLVQEPHGVTQIATNRWSEGLASSLRTFAERYALPMIITETSIEGDDETRSGWVQSSTRSVEALREEGLDIRGYTWWPLFDFVDWSYASGGRNVEEFEVADHVVESRTLTEQNQTGKTPFLRRMGLIRLEEQPDGSLTRVSTPAADAFARGALLVSAQRDSVDEASA